MAVPSIGHTAGLASPTAGAPNALGQLGSALGQMNQLTMQDQLKTLMAKQQMMDLVGKISQEMRPAIEASGGTDPNQMRQLEALYKMIGLQAPIVPGTPGTSTTTQQDTTQKATPDQKTSVQTGGGTAQPQSMGRGRTEPGGTASKQQMDMLKPGQAEQTLPSLQVNTPGTPRHIDEGGLIGVGMSMRDVPMADYQQLMQMSPQARQQWIQQHGIRDADEAWLSMPAQLNPAEKIAMQTSLRSSISVAAKDGPAALEQMLAINRDNFLAAGMDVDAIKRDPELLRQETQLAAAQLQKMQDAGIKLRKVDIPEAQAKLLSATSLDDLRKIQGEVMGAKIHQMSVMEMTSMQNASAHSMAAAAAAQNAATRLDEVRNGTYDARMNAAIKIKSDLRKAYDDSASDYRGLLNIANQAQINGEAPSPELVQAATDAMHARDAAKAQLDVVNSPSFRTKSISNSLNKSGVAVQGAPVIIPPTAKKYTNASGVAIYYVDGQGWYSGTPGGPGKPYQQ